MSNVRLKVPVEVLWFLFIYFSKISSLNNFGPNNHHYSSNEGNLSLHTAKCQVVTINLAVKLCGQKLHQNINRFLLQTITLSSLDILFIKRQEKTQPSNSALQLSGMDFYVLMRLSSLELLSIITAPARSYRTQAKIQLTVVAVITTVITTLRFTEIFKYETFWHKNESKIFVSNLRFIKLFELANFDKFCNYFVWIGNLL